MPRDTLLDFFDDRIRSSADFLIYDNGLVSRSFTYNDVRRTALGFAAALRAAGIGKDDKALFWGENRPEWVMAFWGCVLEGVVVVPLDYRASTDLFARVMEIVQARAVVVGEEVPLPPLNQSVRIWKLAELVGTGSTSRHRARDEDPGLETTLLRSSSRLVRPPSQKGSSSRTATSWRTSSRSNARSRSTGTTVDLFSPCGF